MPLSVCYGKQSFVGEPLSINADRWQLLRLHSHGRVPFVMVHASPEIVLVGIATRLCLVTKCKSALGMCEMDEESRLAHTSLVRIWVGIIANSWRGAEKAASPSACGPLICSTGASSAKRVRLGRGQVEPRHPTAWRRFPATSNGTSETRWWRHHAGMRLRCRC
jgi:hypothetical protein